MKTQTIEVPNLPEGWKAVAYRVPQPNEFILCDAGVIQVNKELITHKCPWLILEKIQPRRIVLDENVLNDVCWVFIDNYGKIIKEQYTNNMFNNIKQLLRIAIESYLEKHQVEETNEEPKLCLSVDECKAILSSSWTIIEKIREFIKENS